MFLSVLCLARASGSGSVLVLQTSRHHRFATQSETDIQTDTPCCAVLLRFSSPAWTSPSLPFSVGVWIACSYSLTASPTSPSPPAGQASNSIPLPVLPEESGLLACRLSPRPTSSRHVLCGPPAGHCGGIQVIKIAAFQLFHGTHESRRSADEPPPPLLSPSPGASFLCHLNPPSSP